jgi:hypothetical protein
MITEQEWPDSDELWRMLNRAFATGRFSARKQFLFCVRACRLRGEAIPADYLPILDDLEAFADSPELIGPEPGANFWTWQAKLWRELATGPLRERFAALQERATEIRSRRPAALLGPGEPMPGEGDPRFEADEAVAYALLCNPFACARGDGQGSILRSRPESDLLRELLGNPLRPLPALPPSALAWNDGCLVKLAQAVYAERALSAGTFDGARVAVLADALEEAGADVALPEHLRGPGPHGRGCWAVDLVLNKE